MCLKEAKFDSEPTLSYSIGLPLLPNFFTVVHDISTPMKQQELVEPHLVERRLSFDVEVTTASGNWKHPVPSKIILVLVSNGYYSCRNCWH